MAEAAVNRNELARPLPQLVPLINEEIRRGTEAGIEHFRAAGELLLEAKEQVRHGEWEAWLKRNFRNTEGRPLTKQVAHNWMRLAETAGKSKARFTFQTMSEALRPNQPTHHRPAFHEPVREAISRVNIEALTQERQTREKEARMFRQLALQLIDIGYKALATKLHPDRGGSDEAMARLNKVRDRLKNAVL